MDNEKNQKIQVDTWKTLSMFDANNKFKNIVEEYEKWWIDTSDKYMWESTDNSFWSIDFKSRKVYLVDE